MSLRVTLLAAALAVLTACSSDHDPVEEQVVRPNMIVDFNFLYSKNCAGCHGPDGKGGVAIALADPVYLAIADDAIITRVATNGVPGTSMPAFAQHSGGMLTDDQVAVITKGIRAWAKPDAVHDTPPPHEAKTPGDAKRGEAAYEMYCSSCHGAGGRGGTKGSSIVDPAYLSMVSDQNLRTTIIAGRPEIGAPDWRGNLAGKAMSPDDVSDVVAWLASQRPQGGKR
jgi:cytochrome c oxidase cbb3-type subunit III